jgi:hypothetical protein
MILTRAEIDMADFAVMLLIMINERGLSAFPLFVKHFRAVFSDLRLFEVLSFHTRGAPVD